MWVDDLKEPNSAAFTAAADLSELFVPKPDFARSVSSFKRL